MLITTMSFGQSIVISCDNPAICPQANAVFSAQATSAVSPHFQWKINGINAGSDIAVFSSATLHEGDAIDCQLLNSRRDSVIASSNTIYAHITPYPNAGYIIGPDSRCYSDSITLADAIPGGIWINVGDTDFVISEGIMHYVGVANFHHSKSALIQYIVSNACGSDTAAKGISAFFQPDAWFKVSSALCVGQSVEVIGPMWEVYPNRILSMFGRVGNGILTDEPSLVGMSPGIDTLLGISSNSCGADTYRVAVTVIDTAHAGTIVLSRDHLCTGDSITISDTGYSGTSWWWRSSSNVTVAANGTVKALSAGEALITFCARNGCGTAATSQSIFVSLSCPINSGSVTMPRSIFPNPAFNSVTIEADPALIDRAIVRNVLGQTLGNYTITQSLTEIDISLLPKGIYIVQFWDDLNIEFTTRLLKE